METALVSTPTLQASAPNGDSAGTAPKDTVAGVSFVAALNGALSAETKGGGRGDGASGLASHGKAGSQPAVDGASKEEPAEPSDGPFAGDGTVALAIPPLLASLAVAAPAPTQEEAAWTATEGGDATVNGVVGVGGNRPTSATSLAAGAYMSARMTAMPPNLGAAKAVSAASGMVSTPGAMVPSTSEPAPETSQLPSSEAGSLAPQAFRPLATAGAGTGATASRLIEDAGKARPVEKELHAGTVPARQDGSIPAGSRSGSEAAMVGGQRNQDLTTPDGADSAAMAPTDVRTDTTFAGEDQTRSAGAAPDGARVSASQGVQARHADSGQSRSTAWESGRGRVEAPAGPANGARTAGLAQEPEQSPAVGEVPEFSTLAGEGASNLGGQGAPMGDPASTMSNAIRGPQMQVDGGLERPASVAGQIADQVQRLEYPRNSHVRVHLHPADLGAVDLSLTLKGGMLALEIHAASEQGRGVIESALPQLRAALLDRGIDVGSLSLTSSRQPSDFGSYSDNGHRGAFGYAGWPGAESGGQQRSPERGFMPRMVQAIQDSEADNQDRRSSSQLVDLRV